MHERAVESSHPHHPLLISSQPNSDAADANGGGRCVTQEAALIQTGLINRGVQPAAETLGCGAGLCGGGGWTRGDEGADGDTKLDLCVPLSLNHPNVQAPRNREWWLRRLGGGGGRGGRGGRLCSSRRVIGAFSSAPSALIMQLNAALQIPAAAQPHYERSYPPALPSSPFRHRQNQSVCLFFSVSTSPQPSYDSTVTFSTIHSQHFPPPLKHRRRE